MIPRPCRPPKRPGRPAEPMEGRGERPYDPRRWTPKRQKIILGIYRNRAALEQGDLLLCDLARELGTSLSYLSIVKNSPWGQERLRMLAEADPEGGKTGELRTE